jgi:hypothetical protein
LPEILRFGKARGGRISFMDLSGRERQINRESSENNGRKSEDACEPHKPIRVNSNRIVHRRAGITDDIMAGSFCRLAIKNDSSADSTVL